MSSARYFVYRYEENPDTDEVEFDQIGETPIPKQDSVIERKAAKWRVVSVQVEAFSANTPIFRVSLHRLPPGT